MTRPRRPGQGGPPEKERAFELLFREKTFALVWRWLTRLGVPLRDRGDLAQDVLLSAYLSFDNYKPEISRPERWLNRIAVHTAAHYRERAQYRYEELVSEEEFPVLVDQSKTPDELMISDQERLMVLELLHHLDVDAHSILVAHDLDGVPMADLAQQRGIPLSTAYKWRARALAMFHDIVAKRRREDRKKEGPRFVVPVDLAALFATARVAPRVPEDVRLSILRGVQESVRAIEEGGAGKAAAGLNKALSDVTTWVKGLWKLLQQLLPGAGVGPLVAAPVAAAAIAGALWLALREPDPPPALAVTHVGPAITAAVPPPVEPEPPAPLPPPAVAEPVEPPPRSAPEPRRQRLPEPESVERAPEPAEAAEPAEPAQPAQPAGALTTPGGDRDMELFEACSKALDQRDWSRAMKALERYEREMPKSAFGSERTVLWIRALRLAGRHSEARALLAQARLDSSINQGLLDELDENVSRP
ncbi:sigma-70 family RNA polymerase sigma factor [Sorangium sp. So ce291]|uniref:RNA polymerase sigma factor n=1 Tax=Sorangium sp. So ce291 TaxID=3133294 RepID=UPI003F62D521